MSTWCVILNLLFMVAGIIGWPPYRYEIPNGGNVPVPVCPPTLLSMIGIKFSFNTDDQTVGHASQPIPGVQANLNRFGLVSLSPSNGFFFTVFYWRILALVSQPFLKILKYRRNKLSFYFSVTTSNFKICQIKIKESIN